MSTDPNEKLNIIMLGQKTIPSREGGVEVVVEELSTRMAALGHHVLCLNRKSNDNHYNDSHYKGVALKDVPTINVKGFAAMSSSIMATIRAAFSKSDIIHFHAEGTCGFLWFAHFRGKKCIVTIHGLDHQRDKWGYLARAYIKGGEKCAAKFADEIIVLSRNVEAYFKTTYNRSTHFIPNGVTAMPRRKPAVISDTYGLDTDDYILFLGRLVPEKGVKELICAYQQVHTDKKLVIAGSSGDTDDYVRECKTMARNHTNIIFTGFVRGTELEELYSNAYIYVLPSKLEGMPLSLLEAMSYGNCCLTSDIKECISVTGDHGVSYHVQDIEDLVDRLQFLCDHQEVVYKYKREASDYVSQNFNWDDVVNRTLSLYRSVM